MNKGSDRMIRPEWFFENGCELCSPSPDIFMAIYMATDGRPCGDCNCKDTCPAWPLINHPTTKVKPSGEVKPTVKVETNAEIAERLGVSKRQVAKMRREGKLS